ncbi:MAG: hypothetical protein M1813_009296 [Trichoglossum hirsutum]|nr:MAG: hypothetical protein M1813_009296 [Trichoglossum hirsutum]
MLASMIGFFTPLQLATISGKEENVRTALKEGANVMEVDENGETALHYAVQLKDKNVAELLIQEGANVSEKSKHGSTALHLAAGNDCKEMVKMLLETPQIVADLRDNYGLSPLAVAACCGSYEVAMMLMNRKDVDPSSKDVKGWSPLMWAIEGYHKDLVSAMLDAGGINIDARDNTNSTALHHAISTQQESIVNKLMNMMDLTTEQKLALRRSRPPPTVSSSFIVGLAISCSIRSLNDGHVAVDGPSRSVEGNSNFGEFVKSQGELIKEKSLVDRLQN